MSQAPQTTAAVPSGASNPPAAFAHDDLQRVLFYADQLHMSRFSQWLIAHYALMAVVAAAFASLPNSLVLAFAVLGCVISGLWCATALSLSTRINVVNDRIKTDHPGSVTAWYLEQGPKLFKPGTVTAILTWVLPGVMALGWVVIAVARVTKAP